MLTKVTIRNFKLFDGVDIELSDRVVFIGPNNSGKTSALQALALWDTGIKRWMEKRGGASEVPKKRPGVTINRRDLIAAPVPGANLLWKDLRVRESAGKGTQNVRIDVVVEGVTNGKSWRCGLEFDYANEESLYCRPLRLNEGNDPDRLPIPEQVSAVRMAYLPPMSGLAANETRLDSGAINVRLGEGRTAEVLRNLCHEVLSRETSGEEDWQYITSKIKSQFGVDLDKPRYIPERGEISMTYTTGRARLDLSSTGRGLQQTLLLLAHMMVNPGSILLLDEPDAHLEILRQRQIYNLLTEMARDHDNQLIAASHSEVILNEAADRDTVVAFVGKPHRIDGSGSQVLKSLKEIGFDQYYQAEETGWVLYLEGSTDLAILRAFAQVLKHPVREHLERPFTHYVMNQPRKAQEHFYGLREAKETLVGVAIYDRLEKKKPPDDPNLIQLCWERREIENYLCTKEVLLAWAKDAARTQVAAPLFEPQWPNTMNETIAEIEDANVRLLKPSPWGPDAKVTDDFLDPLFSTFFKKLDLPNSMQKTSYHVLAGFVAPGGLDQEVSMKLDSVVKIAEKARNY